MAEMILNKKAKCGGCLALRYKEFRFSCGLGVAIKQNITNKKGYAPVPKKDCYKPTTESRYRKLRKEYKDEQETK